MDAIIDTSILIDMHRNYSPAVAWAQSNSGLRLGITPIVWMEMVEGTRDKLDLRLTVRLLTRFPIIYLEKSDMTWAMRQFHKYKLRYGMDSFDCLIAAPAHRLQLPLYTRNLKHLSPMLGALAQKPY